MVVGCGWLGGCDSDIAWYSPWLVVVVVNSVGGFAVLVI